MKTAICYYSRHHGNTLSVLDAMTEGSDVDLIDVTARMAVRLDQYDRIGFASGITLGLATTMGGIVAPLLGKIADTWGLGAALQTMSVFAILGTIFAFLLASPSRNLTE